MNNKELFPIKQTLENCKDLRGVDFAHFRAKTLKQINEEIEIINDIIKPNDKFIEFERKRISLCEEFSKKDNNGKAILKIINNTSQYDIDEKKKAEFENKIISLQDEYFDELRHRESQITEVNLFLEKEISLELNKIKKSDIPKDIRAEDYEILMPLIIE